MLIDLDGFIHTLGLIEEDTDWTDCGQGFSPADGWETGVDFAGVCEDCVRLLWLWISLDRRDLEEIAEKTGHPFASPIEAHNGGENPQT